MSKVLRVIDDATGLLGMVEETMESKPHFSLYQLQSGDWAWGLYTPAGTGRACIAVAHGFKNEREASAAVGEFKQVVAAASVLSVTTAATKPAPAFSAPPRRPRPQAVPA